VPSTDYADEQNHLASRRGRFIAPSADLSALGRRFGILIILLKLIIGSGKFLGWPDFFDQRPDP
jgi:hypothetical protein